MHVDLVVNPAARGGRSAESDAVRAFAELGVTATVHRTAATGDAGRIATALAPQLRERALYVLGGDGTVMEAVGALVGRDVAVGVLPGGTGNQLARHLGIPLSVSAAVRALVGARPRHIDLGRLQDGRHFALTAGFGLDAAMIARTSAQAKRRFGVAAYIWGAALAARRPRPFDVRIELDGRVVEREAAIAMIANVEAVMDGRFALGPGVRADDGFLDVCVLTARGLRDGAALAWRLARRDWRDDPRMFFARARTAHLTVGADVLAQADGELLTTRGLSASAVPGGGRFLAPPV